MGFIVLILLFCVALFVFLSHAFAWYEAANASPELLEGRFRVRHLFFAINLLRKETLWLCCCLVSLPFGLLPQKRPPQEKTNGPPLIFLHGLFQNRACWWWLRFRLRCAGYSNQYSINLPFWRDIESLSEEVAKTVDQVRHRQEVDKVILIGHSMGGILARNYIQRRGGTDRVSCCILLGTPNHGSKLVPFAVSRLARHLLPQSPFLLELNRNPFPQRVPLVNIFSWHDNLVLPPDNARLSSGREIELRSIGHAGLLFHSRTFHSITESLKEISACSQPTSPPESGSN
ncbi:MAG: hypothetical protein C0616_11415 [Desulfuromonas sp.]|nr:MAG: hypothetical protein C0616_11415 [Desulfuromonas sp.]